ncbi:MAG TPA: hypothetical protein VN580_00930 [Clostridia bacterium]|nr:hypothetical protein [Clostridia bacterium]
MKRFYACLILFLIVLFAAGCTDGSREAADKIAPPHNRLIPVVGTWEVAGVIEGGALKLEEPLGPWNGKSLQFSEDYALFGDNILEKPRYKIKRVNKEEYLLYGHKSLPKALNMTGKALDVITVTDKDKFICEILRVNDEAVVLEIDNRSLYLKKISGQVSRRSDIKYREISGSLEPEADTGKGPTRTGVLIGLCSQEAVRNNKAAGTYNYRTLWIAATDKKLHPVLNTQGILFPRRSGFWRIETKRTAEAGHMEDFIIAHPVAVEQHGDKTDIPMEPAVKQEVRTGGVTRLIRYVGNDYVSVESKYADTSESVLQVLPIDSLPGIKGVKLSDLYGEAGAAFMEEGRKKAVELLEAEGGSLTRNMTQPESFGLERKMGHWFFKGRINYRKDTKVYSVDYSINVIPPAELIFYDELSVTWTEVKDKLPEAVDVFSSPNRDIALVITKTELVIFDISNGKLGDQPLEKVPLKAGEAVIMAEWATGRYVEAWESSFRVGFQQ